LDRDTAADIMEAEVIMEGITAVIMAITMAGIIAANGQRFHTA
jgi:hypothetical protein